VTAEESRRTSLLAGLFFFGTIVFSIPGRILYGPLLDDVNYIVGGGADTQVRLGASFEVLTAIANIGTAVILFPVLKRASEKVALGYVALRIVESTIIIVGLMSLLSIVALRADVADTAGGNSALYVGLGQSLQALAERTFLLGPAFCAGFGNGILLGYLFYRSELVPRGWALFGMIAGTLTFGGATVVLLGADELQSTTNSLLTAPEIVWEVFISIYLTFKGFRPSSILSDSNSSDGRTAPELA
jgi:hypothetical protein